MSDNDPIEIQTCEETLLSMDKVIVACLGYENDKGFKREEKHSRVIGMVNKQKPKCVKLAIKRLKFIIGQDFVMEQVILLY